MGRRLALVPAAVAVFLGSSVSAAISSTAAVQTPNTCVYNATMRFTPTVSGGTSVSLLLDSALGCAPSIEFFHSVADAKGPSNINPCASTAGQTLVLTMNRDSYYGAPQELSTWTLTGNKARGYTVDFKGRPGDSGKGAFVATQCGNGYAKGNVSLSRTAGGAVVEAPNPFHTDVFRCSATGQVGSMSYGGGHDLLSGFSVYGQASGAGTCNSLHDSWRATYTGDWGYNGSTSYDVVHEYCGGAGFSLTLVLTSLSTGQVRTLKQTWDQPAVDGPAIAVFNPEVLNPSPSGATTLLHQVGAGTLIESPISCGIAYQQGPSQIDTKTTWAFALG